MKAGYEPHFEDVHHLVSCRLGESAIRLSGPGGMTTVHVVVKLVKRRPPAAVEHAGNLNDMDVCRNS